jgi:hypothetical protein
MTDSEARGRDAQKRNYENMSDFEKLSIKTQEEMDEYLKRIADNTEPQNGPAKSLNYSLAGIGDIWSIVRQGL